MYILSGNIKECGVGATVGGDAAALLLQEKGDMDAVESPAGLEPRSERIARYKAERRRELAERYGNTEELPSKQGSQDSASTLSGEGHLLPGGLDVPQVHTRVSVGQLRSALLQQTGSGGGGGEQPEKACPDGGRATSSLDLAVNPGPEGGRRRTRRYLPGGPGVGRKTSERFRTQPITANEMEESSGLLDADQQEEEEEEEEEKRKADVKTDDRAKMSVAAKMSLFKELEKAAAPEASAFLKPRSGSVCHERRARRSNDHRFLTQPITCEEMVAISAPKPALPAEAPSVQAESVEDVDESCRLSVSEKLALFNKLALPGRKGAGSADRPPERRRQKGARYRTQPITVEEVSLLQKGPVQLPAFCLSPHLSDRQQASSVNLKPSEVRLSRPRADADAEPSPGQQGPQRHDPEPGLRGILKKSRGGGSEQRREASGVEGGSLSAPPWRQRARSRRETIGCVPIRAASEQDAPQQERPCQAEPQEQLTSSVDTRRDLVDEGTTATGRVQVGPRDDASQPPETSNTRTEETQTLGSESVTPQCWDPVFATVYSSAAPQYIMCFNQVTA
ncbi:putative supervillin-like [Scophthalmus maximus]|uniref:Putative supervillin-like n=1 Tax=Scophthalmus maximus TaxID=52904 RepID=A0A2U9CUM6_SCOMX|nr:putative supervillin-like [Scophthalmus maximus]